MINLDTKRLKLRNILKTGKENSTISFSKKTRKTSSKNWKMSGLEKEECQKLKKNRVLERYLRAKRKDAKYAMDAGGRVTIEQKGEYGEQIC